MFDIIGLFDNVGISIFGLRSPGFVQSRPKSGPAMGVLQSTNTLDEVRTVAAVAGDGVDTMSPGKRHQKHQQKIEEMSRVLSYIINIYDLHRYSDIGYRNGSLSKTLETTFVNFSLAIKPCNFPHALIFLGKGQRHDASCIICITLAVAFLKDHSVPVSGVSIEIISEIIIEQLSSCPYREWFIICIFSSWQYLVEQSFAA